MGNNPAEILEAQAARGLMPPPRLTVSEWADAYRMLSPETCPEPGQWSTARVPYMREVMDVVNDPLIEEIAFMSSSQVSKTECTNNIIGYFIDQDPCPILYVLPTVEMAQDWSKERLAPMLRDTPCLRGKVREVRAKSDNSTLLRKSFPGGHLSVVGANAPSGLAARPIRVVICDEVDRFPPSAGHEGDPVNLAFARTKNFWNRKKIIFSTPTIKGISRIEPAYDASDKRRFYVPCVHCGHFQVLRFPQLKWDKNDAGDYDPKTTRYICEKCEASMTDMDKPKFLRRGEWRAENPSVGAVGFRINELYSPWVRWADIVKGFLECKKRPETLKTWVNQTLGETWEQKGDSIESEEVYKRCEDYPENAEGTRLCPVGVCVITAGVDVQENRLEVEFVGWGRHEESWSMEYAFVAGDTAQPAIWDQLDLLLSRRFEHVLGTTLQVAAVFVDSGFRTADVYRFVKPRRDRRVWASKGIAGWGRPLLGRPSSNNRARVMLWPLGVDSLKETVFARLNIKGEGPGFCHFPRGYDHEFFAQLTAERIVPVDRHGFSGRCWEKMRTRNEALDCRVLAYAALISLSHDVPHLLERLADENQQLAAAIKAESPAGTPSKPGTPAVPTPPTGTAPRIKIKKSAWLAGLKRF
jgi:phage terminase large subunit GpA-like protein